MTRTPRICSDKASEVHAIDLGSLETVLVDHATKRNRKWDAEYCWRNAATKQDWTLELITRNTTAYGKHS